MRRDDQVVFDRILIAALAEPVGRCAPVPEALGKAVVKADCVRFKPGEAVEQRFLLYSLNSPQGLRRAEELSHGMGRLRINMGNMRELPVAVAPLNEQRRIVEKIEALMARSRRAKEALDAIPPLLERFRQSVLAAAFRGDLTADWRAKNPDVEPADELLKRIRVERRRRWEEDYLAKQRAKGKEPNSVKWRGQYKAPDPVDASELPELPDGWCWSTADALCWEVTVGHVGPMRKQYVDEGVPFLRSQNVRENRFDSMGLLFINEAFHQKLRKSALGPGDVVLVRSGAPGTACVVPPELKEANCADLVIARPLTGVDPYLMAFYMNCPSARAHVRGVQVGVAQQHFNVGSMKLKPMPVVPSAEQPELRQRIEEALLRADAIEEQVRAAAAGASQVSPAILAKAFRGELVPQDPNDEPASALLDRIRTERGAALPKKRSRRTKRSARSNQP